MDVAVGHLVDLVAFQDVDHLVVVDHSIVDFEILVVLVAALVVLVLDALVDLAFLVVLDQVVGLAAYVVVVQTY